MFGNPGGHFDSISDVSKRKGYLWDRCSYVSYLTGYINTAGGARDLVVQNNKVYCRTQPDQGSFMLSMFNEKSGSTIYNKIGAYGSPSGSQLYYPLVEDSDTYYSVFPGYSYGTLIRSTLINDGSQISYGTNLTNISTGLICTGCSTGIYKFEVRTDSTSVTVQKLNEGTNGFEHKINIPYTNNMVVRIGGATCVVGDNIYIIFPGNAPGDSNGGYHIFIYNHVNNTAQYLGRKKVVGDPFRNYELINDFTNARGGIGIHKEGKIYFAGCGQHIMYDIAKDELKLTYTSDKYNSYLSFNVCRYKDKLYLGQLSGDVMPLQIDTLNIL